MGNGLNGYSLTKGWFEFVLDHPGTINASHTSLYLVLIEINNRLDWRENFAITSSECMALMPCSSRTTFSKCLKDLVDWGFVDIVIKSSNQYSANVISLYKKCTSTSTASEQPAGEPSVQPLVQQVNYSKTVKPLNSKTKKNGKEQFRKSLLDLGANEQHVDDWIEVRSQKKASFTETALKALIKECQENNFPIDDAVRICAENSWQGFKYKWILNQNTNEKFNANKKTNNELISSDSKFILNAKPTGYINHD